MIRSESPVLQVAEAIKLCNVILRELPLEVEGEVAGYSLARGQFVFFDLKDENADARLACFMMADRLSAPLENGMRVLVSGTPGLYQKSGAFRLTLTKVQPRGEGSLQRAFELLRLKLEADGMFDPARKRALPRFVREVGIVSSSGAAGFEDFMKIARDRLPGILFYLINVAVQGEKAEAEIVAAFDRLNERSTLDAIVLVRGGGSIEDLHAFNSEAVARAIIRSKAPVLVGVGHERDLTIADMAADVRASTPSNAAQLLLPTTEEVEGLIQRLTSGSRQILIRQISDRQYQVRILLQSIRTATIRRFALARSRVEALMATIVTISPQATLQRGFTLTFDESGQPLKSVAGVLIGTSISTRFADGSLTSLISIDETL